MTIQTINMIYCQIKKFKKLLIFSINYEAIMLIRTISLEGNVYLSHLVKKIDYFMNYCVPSNQFMNVVINIF